MHRARDKVRGLQPRIETKQKGMYFTFNETNTDCTSNKNDIGLCYNLQILINDESRVPPIEKAKLVFIKN